MSLGAAVGTAGLLKRKFLCPILALAVIAAGAQLASAATKDRIAAMSQAVYKRAGGTDKGITQEKFKAAEGKIDDALDKLTEQGVIGGDPPPAVVIKRDLSKKELITSEEFLHYFRGMASERDIDVRRKLVDLAIGQAGVAKAAADAAREEALARQAAADAALASEMASQNGGRPLVVGVSADTEKALMQLEDALKKHRLYELAWYNQHPSQPVPAPQTSTTADNRGGSTNGLITGGGASNGGVGIGTWVVGNGSGGGQVINTVTLQNGIGVIPKGGQPPRAANPANSGNNSSNSKNKQSN